MIAKMRRLCFCFLLNSVPGSIGHDGVVVSVSSPSIGRFLETCHCVLASSVSHDSFVVSVYMEVLLLSHLHYVLFQLVCISRMRFDL